MKGMFRYSGFAHDIGGWNVVEVTDMSHMFDNATQFNQDIGDWNVSGVTDMRNMFENAVLFDQDIGGWNVADVNDMSYMFYSAQNFDRDIGGWAVSNVNDMSYMFYVATRFNQNLRQWDVQHIDSEPTGFDDAATAWTNAAWRPQWGQVPPPNIAPVANAGPDQTVASGAVVTLDGSGSLDAEGEALAYSWTQTSGTAVTLSSASAAQPSFTAPTIAPGTLTTLVFSLIVSDGSAASAADTVTITVSSMTPAQSFDLVRTEIETELSRNASTQMTMLDRSAQQVARAARGRFLSRRSAQAGGAFSDWSGGFDAKQALIQADAAYFLEARSSDGQRTRRVDAEIAVLRGDDGEHSTHANVLMQWDHQATDNTMVGYFLGARYGANDIGNAGAITGDHRYLGTQAGAYFVQGFANGAIVDGYASGALVRSDYYIASSLMTATSQYNQRSVALGLAVTGVIDHARAQIHPSLGLRFAKTYGQTALFTVKTLSATDVTSAVIGAQSYAVLDFAPELVFELSGVGGLEGGQLSLVPSLFCERWVRQAVSSGCGQSIGLTVGALVSRRSQLDLGATHRWVDGKDTSELTATLSTRF
jgi:surface protein